MTVLPSRYLIKWGEKLNGPLAARLDELVDVVLDDDALDQPPETWLRRAEREREVKAVPFEEFDWITSCLRASHERHPYVLCFLSGYTIGEDLSMQVLKDSHEIKRAGLALRNCAANNIKNVRKCEEILIVICHNGDVDKSVAMAAWDGNRWTQMYESGNTPIRPEWKSLFEAIVGKIPLGITTTMQIALEAKRIAEYAAELERNHMAVLKNKLTIAMRLGSLRKTSDAIKGVVSQKAFTNHLTRTFIHIGQCNPINGSQLASILRASLPMTVHKNFGFGKMKKFVEALPIESHWNGASFTFFWE